METLRLEHYLIMAGFALLILNGLGRSRKRGKPAKGTGSLTWWRQYGDFIALGMVAAGLVGMMLHK